MGTKKQTYSVTLSDGTVETRTTNRMYTDVVAVIVREDPIEALESRIARLVDEGADTEVERHRAERARSRAMQAAKGRRRLEDAWHNCPAEQLAMARRRLKCEQARRTETHAWCWCGSLQLACKKAGELRKRLARAAMDTYCDVRVVPVPEPHKGAAGRVVR